MEGTGMTLNRHMLKVGFENSDPRPEGVLTQDNSSIAGRALTCGTGFCLILFLGLTAPLAAQDEDQHFTANVGGGLTTITGRDAGRLDHGGNLQVGAGYFFNRFFGVTGNFMFNQLGITSSELLRLNVPDGNARVYTFTVDPTLRLPLGQHWSVYVLAGGGYLRRTVQFTQPTVAETFVFDPWWGYFGPALVPANEILGSVSSNAGAFNVGGGINIPLPVPRLKLFIESRYVHGFTDKSNTAIVPISVGLRW
jgi:opacity protein-like surface antigen